MKLFVPGRICLFGEHSDWAGGYRKVNSAIEKGFTLIAGTDQGIHADVRPHPDSLVLTSTGPGGKRIGPHEISMEPPALLEEAKQGGFWSYIAGVAYELSLRYPVRGLILDNYRTDLPIKKGLSSSAAICVLTARGFSRAYELGLGVREEMEIAYRGEILTGSRCGRMDQGCAFGRRTVLMRFDGDLLEARELRIARELHLVTADLGGQKNTKRILESLNRCYPFASDEIGRGVQELLGPINRRIVGEAAEALQAGNARRLGELMTEAQSHFDRYAGPACPGELTAPALHHLLQDPRLAPHIWGGKGVGSQGDGSAQFVARSKEDQQALMNIISTGLGLGACELTILPRASHQKHQGPSPSLRGR